MAYPTLILGKGRERSLRNRHPWVFSGAVEACETEEAGAIVRIKGAGGETYGYGHLAPQAPIRAKVFCFSGDASLRFDERFWLGKLTQAWAHRQRYLELRHTDGFRLVNAEGDGLPGLVVDRYADLAVVQARGAGTRALQSVWLPWLQTELGCQHVLLKEATPEACTWLGGEAEKSHFTENGLRFELHPRTGQKTGFFLDQRPARELVGRLAKGRRVLNLFAYSGGFGLYALKGGAVHAASVDISEDACALAEANAAHNGFGAAHHTALAADAFQYLRSLAPGQFDLVVLDPPAFTKHPSTVDKAARGYKDLNLKALQVLPPGGLLATFSCSQPIDRTLFRKIVYAAAADAARPVRVLYETGHAPDHPVDIFHPEGGYLKGLVLEVG